MRLSGMDKGDELTVTTDEVFPTLLVQRFYYGSRPYTT